MSNLVDRLRDSYSGNEPGLSVLMRAAEEAADSIEQLKGDLTRQEALSQSLIDERIKAQRHIEQLEAACRLVREKMGTKYNGGVGWMAEFERLAALQEANNG